MHAGIYVNLNRIGYCSFWIRGSVHPREFRIVGSGGWDELRQEEENSLCQLRWQRPEPGEGAGGQEREACQRLQVFLQPEECSVSCCQGALGVSLTSYVHNVRTEEEGFGGRGELCSAEIVMIQLFFVHG